ncbi:trehalose-phosphatase [Phenylobacterium sp.]|uniref:trehalose-phosphatase n=1 Tax=Phenylobacterium sp. TaxID=1871053 RepID=UPI00286B922B|nr:trehalose-phosphatase [Phenylobacterium sp.]
MSIAELQIGLEAPPARLALRGVALFLDLDGTLATIVERPQDVRPDPRRTSMIERLLAALDGRLAVVSGRSLEDIDHILEGRVTTVAAIHGLVRRDANGVIGRAPPHPGLVEAIARLQAFAQRDPNLLIEDKALSLALHYRQAPHLARDVQDLAVQIAADTGLSLQPGDMVVELRTPGASKGDSIRAFMTEPPFAGAMPVFLGDDLTDEHGFFAVRALGGYGVLVGGARRTLARYRLPDVEAALAWLEAAR